MNSNWSYSPETVKLGCDLCDLDLWPFAWTLLWSLVITSENFMMIQWWEHSQKGVTDRRTDGRTDRQMENTICRAAWSQLKITQCLMTPYIATGIWVNIGSDHGLLPDSIKPLPEPILTIHQQGPITLISGQGHKRHNYLSKISFKSPRGQWVKASRYQW